MQQIDDVDRKTLIERYLVGERVKKNRAIPEGYENLQWDCPQSLDQWLQKNQYKFGVLSGFRRWAKVAFSKEDLFNLAVWKRCFPGESQRIGDHVGTDAFLKRVPWGFETGEWTRSPPIWYDPFFRGEFQDQFSIIVRPPCRAERRDRALGYVEDGAGRLLFYCQALVKQGTPSQMTGYFGYDPDPSSIWLQNQLGGEFVRDAASYATFESTWKHVQPRNWWRRILCSF